MVYIVLTIDHMHPNFYRNIISESKKINTQLKLLITSSERRINVEIDGSIIRRCVPHHNHVYDSVNTRLREFQRVKSFNSVETVERSSVA